MRRCFDKDYMKEKPEIETEVEVLPPQPPTSNANTQKIEETKQLSGRALAEPVVSDAQIPQIR